MGQQQRENMGTFPAGNSHTRVKGKESTPSAGTFKSNKILSHLPGHEPLDSAGTKAPGFQDLRNSTIRKGSI